MNIQLMTDGGADVPKDISDQMDILVVPLYILFQDEQYKSDVTIDIPDFYKKIKETNELPRSSAPNPTDFYEAYKQVDPKRPILMLSLSKELSSTYANALIGKDMLLAEEPDRIIEVINTKTASCGVALLLDEANKKIQKGYSFEQLVLHIRQAVEQTATLFVLKTLDNLILGGRLSKVQGTIAKTLNIKLLMRASDEGNIEVTEKVRGNKRSIRRFIEQIGDYTKNPEEKVITMTHCNAENWAKKVLDDILNVYPFKEAYLTEAGPLISTYSGEGALVISFFRSE